MFVTSTLPLMCTLASQMQDATTTRRITMGQNVLLTGQQRKEQYNNQLY
jgi:hypothetical protein